MKNLYSKISSLVYDHTKPPETSIDGDIQFYKNLLVPVQGKVLEAGVGNGRMLISLLKYKVDVIGIDKSQDMLDLCQKNLKENNLDCQIIHGDLCSFIRENYFEYIIMPNASFNLIENRDEAITVLGNFYRSLKKGGTLVIDLILPIDFVQGSLYEYSYQIDEVEVYIKNYSKEINWIKQCTINEIDYFIDNKLVEKQNFILSWYGIEEFCTILREIGYKKQEILINYGNKIIASIKTITFIFKK